MHSPCICICSTCSGLLLCLSVKYLSSPLGQCWQYCIACVVVIWSQCCGSVAWADWQSQKLGANAHRLVVHHIKNPCRRLHQIMLLQIRCETLLWLWTTCACQRRFPATLVNNGGQRRSVICEHKIQLQEGPFCHIPSTICTARVPCLRRTTFAAKFKAVCTIRGRDNEPQTEGGCNHATHYHSSPM